MIANRWIFYVGARLIIPWRVDCLAKVRLRWHLIRRAAHRTSMAPDHGVTSGLTWAGFLAGYQRLATSSRHQSVLSLIRCARLISGRRKPLSGDATAPLSVVPCSPDPVYGISYQNLWTVIIKCQRAANTQPGKLSIWDKVVKSIAENSTIE
jgi:hypothetical protein